MMQNSSIYLVGMSNHIFNLIFKILQYPVVSSLCWYVYFKVFLKRTWFCKVNFWLWEISRNGDRIYSFSASYFPISQKSLDQNSSLTALWHNNWSSSQSVLALYLAYWCSFSLQVAQMKHIFFNWYSLHARLSSHCKASSCKKKKHKKIKACRKSV